VISAEPSVAGALPEDPLGPWWEALGLQTAVSNIM
jgi:hypothetical protein